MNYESCCWDGEKSSISILRPAANLGYLRPRRQQIFWNKESKRRLSQCAIGRNIVWKKCDNHQSSGNNFCSVCADLAHRIISFHAEHIPVQTPLRLRGKKSTAQALFWKCPQWSVISAAGFNLREKSHCGILWRRRANWIMQTTGRTQRFIYGVLFGRDILVSAFWNCMNVPVKDSGGRVFHASHKSSKEDEAKINYLFTNLLLAIW